jgi:hypothetical protein
LKDPIPKSLLKAELALQIGQIKSLLGRLSDSEQQVQTEVSEAIDHLYKAKKILNLDNMN